MSNNEKEFERDSNEECLTSRELKIKLLYLLGLKIGDYVKFTRTPIRVYQIVENDDEIYLHWCNGGAPLTDLVNYNYVKINLDNEGDCNE